MRAAAVLVLGVLALSGCGGGSSDSRPPEPARSNGPLTRRETRLVQESEQAVETYCRQIAARLSGRRGRLSTAEQAPAFDAVERLVELGRAKPGAQVRPGIDVRTAIGDLAENLEGSNCDSRLLERLDQGLATLPM
jgi:hypothetical protein